MNNKFTQQFLLLTYQFNSIKDFRSHCSKQRKGVHYVHSLPADVLAHLVSEMSKTNFLSTMKDFPISVPHVLIIHPLELYEFILQILDNIRGAFARIEQRFICLKKILNSYSTSGSVSK